MILNLNADGTFRYTRDNRLYTTEEKNTHGQFSLQKYALNIISTLEVHRNIQQIIIVGNNNLSSAY